MTPEKFWTMVYKTPTANGCWLWMGSRTVHGYGRFKEHGQAFRAHRFALEMAIGRKLKRHEQANHKCNTRHCVRVDANHIYQGNQKENIRDAMTDRRMIVQSPDFFERRRNPRGVDSARAKLNDDAIRLIRKLRKDGFSQQAIADRVNVSQVNVSCILRGATWAHVI